ncbi:helix-turn-helix domain-containing protein [Chryseobacterium sp. GVT01B]|uniref:helix-turn-helix domain-containing protein n=1 Tax=Chryseobacterium sp. GVT01B TaxID=2862675 RepID=UPI001CBC15F8|nr:helix-turn-helix domain-containing protein [Chryseobacterium sp. GVT01B]
MKYSKPDYKKIFNDLLILKFPDKKEQCLPFLNKKELSRLEVIHLNKIIFGENISENLNGRNHRSYDQSTIFKILDYQKKQNLNNIQTAKYFGLSRNTLARWKKIFLD